MIKTQATKELDDESVRCHRECQKAIAERRFSDAAGWSRLGHDAQHAAFALLSDAEKEELVSDETFDRLVGEPGASQRIDKEMGF